MSMRTCSPETSRDLIRPLYPSRFVESPASFSTSFLSAVSGDAGTVVGAVLATVESAELGVVVLESSPKSDPRMPEITKKEITTTRTFFRVLREVHVFFILSTVVLFWAESIKLSDVYFQVRNFAKQLIFLVRTK